MYSYYSNYGQLLRAKSPHTGRNIHYFKKRFYGAAVKKQPKDANPNQGSSTPAPTKNHNTKTKGALSERSKNKIRNKVYSFALCTMYNKKNINFITLTFPAGTQDATAREILNIWLTRVRKYVEERKSNNVLNYVWVSERQKNGTLHFHLLTDTFLNIIKVQNFLNIAIANKLTKEAKAQAITQSQQRFLTNYKNGIQASGIDVKSVKHYQINKVSKYLTKYVTKANNTTVINGSIWNCSQSISQLYTGVGLTEDEVDVIFAKYVENADPETGAIVFKDKHGKPLQGSKKFECADFLEGYFYVNPPPLVCTLLAQENSKILKHPNNMYDLNGLNF